MRRLWSGLPSLALLAALAGCAGPAAQGGDAASCRGPKLGSLPMVPASDGHYVVPVYFGDHPRSMIVDTGAAANVLFRSALAEEGLHETGEHQYGVITEGAAGTARNGVANVPEMKFAGIELTDQTMMVVGAEPPKFDVLPVAGLLGTPFLSVFDLELDFPGQTMALYARARCEAVAPPWRRPFSSLPLTALPDNLRRRQQDVASAVNVTTPGSTAANQARLLIDVQLDGRTQRAMIDTGAGTVLRPEIADRFDLAPVPGARPVSVRGVDGGEVSGETRRAAELRIGDEVLRDKTVLVAPIVNANADMLLGLDAFRGRRVWISFVQKRLFIQPSDSKP